MSKDIEMTWGNHLCLANVVALDKLIYLACLCWSFTAKNNLILKTSFYSLVTKRPHVYKLSQVNPADTQRWSNVLKQLTPCRNDINSILNATYVHDVDPTLSACRKSTTVGTYYNCEANLSLILYFCIIPHPVYILPSLSSLGHIPAAKIYSIIIVGGPNVPFVGATKEWF